MNKHSIELSICYQEKDRTDTVSLDISLTEYTKVYKNINGPGSYEVFGLFLKNKSISEYWKDIGVFHISSLGNYQTVEDFVNENLQKDEAGYLKLWTLIGDFIISDSENILNNCESSSTIN